MSNLDFFSLEEKGEETAEIPQIDARLDRNAAVKVAKPSAVLTRSLYLVCTEVLCFVHVL